jgi:hypothetical protein
MDGWWEPYNSFQANDAYQEKKETTGKTLAGETKAEPCTSDVDGKKNCKSEN